MILLLAACAAPPSGAPAPQDPSVCDLDPPELCAVCGDGPWGDAVGDVYVALGASGGDGSADAPLGSLDEVPPDPGVVVLGAGAWPAIALDGVDGLGVRGRCVEAVTVLPDGDGVALRVDGGRATVEGLTVAGRLVVQGAADLGAGGIVVQGATGTAVKLTGESSLSLVDAVVGPGVPAGSDGVAAGIEVDRGGRLVAERVEVRGAAGMAVALTGADVTATLTEVRLLDTTGDAEGWGFGALVQQGASLEATDLVISGTRYAALLAANGTVDVDGCTVSGNRPREDGLAGTAVLAQDAAEVHLSGCVLSDNEGGGVSALGEGTRVEVVDSEVLENLSAGPREGAAGAAVGAGAQLELVRVTVAGSDHLGVTAVGAAAALSLVDVVVRDTRPVDGIGGVAVDVRDGAVLTADGVEIEGAHHVGMLVEDGASGEVDGVTVEGTAPPADGEVGYGVVVYGATLTGGALTVTSTSGIGFLAAADAVVTLDRLRVAGTSAEPVTGAFGYGLVASDGATVVLAAVESEANTGCGAQVSGAALDIRGGWITTTRRSPSQAVGIGVDVQDAGTAVLEGVVLSGNEGPGAAVLPAAGLELRACVVDGNGFAGVVVADGALLLEGGEVSGTVSDAELGGGVGVLVLDRGGGADATLAQASVLDQPLAAVWVDGDARVQLTESTLQGGPGFVREKATLGGHALLARGARAVALEGVGVAESRVAVLLDDASATLVGTTWTGNGVDLVQQRCEEVAPVDPDGAPVAVLCTEPPLVIVPLEYRTVLATPSVASD